MCHGFGHAVAGVEVDPKRLVEVGEKQAEYANSELMALRLVRVAECAHCERHDADMRHSMFDDDGPEAALGPFWHKDRGGPDA